MRSKEFNHFKRLLQQAKTVLLSTHQLPDGDGLGTESALYYYLKKAGKKVTVLNPDPTPPRYQFLDPKHEYINKKSTLKASQLYDLWIIVDTNDPRRLGQLWGEYSLRSKRIYFIDHHPETLGAPKISYPEHAKVISDIASSSIGEMLDQIFNELKMAPFDADIALGLYVSVMTDTNSFRYTRTTPGAHQIAARCLELGINPEQIYQAIFASKEVSHLKLLGYLLQNVQATPDGRIAWLTLSRSLRKKYLATADDTLSFLNLLLILKKAEVVCLFREEDDGKVRVSIRSKGKVIINQVAMELGGGGHDYSAGVALQASMKKTVDVVIQRLLQLKELKVKQSSIKKF